jgi:solute carrier family 36 (proton-coupled amino acid transporter)
VQFLYSVAILLSIPLQLFPAIRIMENGLFTGSGKADMFVKWQKNIFRFLVVALCTGISWVGAKDLDKFVSFVGSFAWSVSTAYDSTPNLRNFSVPLCYVYPPMLHYKACARTKRERVADIALMVFGAAAAVYTTIQTLQVRDGLFIPVSTLIISF